MELAAVALHNINETPTGNVNYLNQSLDYARKEPVTPWIIADTARHYQWYPFVNVGHYELAKNLTGKSRKEVINFLRQGIDIVWNRAKTNAFYRGIPFTWCSNNLTTSFATQCYWYRQLSGDKRFDALEQACFDWLFGCNPWGSSFVYGLPTGVDTPIDPHSAFTHLKNYPIDGGLVDGPVYGSIYKNLIGIVLKDPDEYADFQSPLVVYHDDYGDYSTNEPTMDGTASLIYLLGRQTARKMIAKSKLKAFCLFPFHRVGSSLSDRLGTGNASAVSGSHCSGRHQYQGNWPSSLPAMNMRMVALRFVRCLKNRKRLFLFF